MLANIVMALIMDKEKVNVHIFNVLIPKIFSSFIELKFYNLSTIVLHFMEFLNFLSILQRIRPKKLCKVLTAHRLKAIPQIYVQNIIQTIK